MRRVSRTLALALACLAALLAGCGDDSSDAVDPVESAREDAERILSSLSVEVSCVSGVTTRFVTDFYGDVETCERLVREQGPEAPVPDVGDVSVTGRVARVELTFPGGPRTIGSMRGDATGEEWRLDSLGVEYQRAELLSSLESLDEGIVAERELNACFRAQVEELSASELSAYTRASALGDDDALRETTFDLLGACPDELGAAVAGQLVGALVASGTVPERLGDCTTRMLAFILPLTTGEDGESVPRSLLEGGEAASEAVGFAGPAIQASQAICEDDPDARLSPAVREALRQTER